MHTKITGKLDYETFNSQKGSFDFSHLRNTLSLPAGRQGGHYTKTALNSKSSALTPRAFTLVELIVVIVILAILGTIAFLSFNSQSASARDSTRLADMSNIAKGLSVFNATSGKVPMPDSKIDILASGATIGYQGYAATNVLNMIKVSNGGKDPLDTTTHYTYSTNLAQSRFQILGFLEDGSNTALSMMPFRQEIPAFARMTELATERASANPSTYSGRYAITKGDQLGILLNSSTWVPAQAMNANIDITTTTGSYVAQFTNKYTVTGTGAKLITLKSAFLQKPDPLLRDTSLIGYWDMETLINSGILADMSGNGNSLNAIGGAQAGSTSGKIGYATIFDGTAKYYSSTSTIYNFSGDLTIMAWVKTNTGGSIVSKSTTWDDGYELQRIFNINNDFLMVTGSGSGFKEIQSPYNSATSDWKFVAGIHKGDTNSIYIDGKITGTITGSTNTIAPSVTSFKIGSQNGTTNNFNGIIDEVRIYTRALSDSEVAALYDVTK